MLPPSEIREALRQVVANHIGCTPEEAVVGAARLFGFRRTGPDLKLIIETEIRRMLVDDELLLRDGQIRLS